MSENSNLWALKITAISIAVICVLVLATSVFYIYVSANPDRDVEVAIGDGLGLNSIAGTLKDAKVIRNKNFFILYSLVAEKDKTMKAGRYIIPKGSNVPSIVAMLTGGLSEPDDISLTIPEGLNIWEIDGLLAKKGYSLEAEFAKQNYFKEGYLFPDTYRLKDPKKSQNPDLLGELIAKMNQNFDQKTDSSLGSLDSGKKKEIIIIVSILEKEAKSAEDMAMVSGIIRNRLERGMHLEVDASVLYGACLREFMEDQQAKNCDVTFQGPAREIKIDSAYNTYTREGLPAGPISNPGLKAINAAINPVKTDYFYYLSTRDGSQLIFSKTAAEHMQNRRKYLGI